MDPDVANRIEPDEPGRNEPGELELPLGRMLGRGPQALTEPELVALVLSEGREAGPESARLARLVLRELRSLERLSEATPQRLCRIAGLTREQAARLASSVELGRRLSAPRPDDAESVWGPPEAARFLVPLLRHQRREVFAILCLDTRGRARAARTISTGSLSASIVHPREVFSEAIMESAASLIIAHNHPSGDPTPSAEDLAITRKLVSAGDILGIPILDHLVVGSDRVTSILSDERVPRGSPGWPLENKEGYPRKKVP